MHLDDKECSLDEVLVESVVYYIPSPSLKMCVYCMYIYIHIKYIYIYSIYIYSIYIYISNINIYIYLYLYGYINIYTLHTLCMYCICLHQNGHTQKGV